MVSANRRALEADVWQVRHTAPVPPFSVRRWVSHCAALCLPEKVYWCDGSAGEREMLRERAQLNEGFRVGMAAFMDQARIPVDPVGEGVVAEPKTPEDLRPLFRGCMKGRTMYVVPLVIRGVDGVVEVRGLQVTDSPAVAADLADGGIPADRAWEAIVRKGPSLFCLHAEGRHAVPVGRAWDFPSGREVWAMGPGFDTVEVVKAMRCGGCWS